MTHQAEDVVAAKSGRQTPRPGFTVGLIAGGIIGSMVALAFAPRAGADLRRRVAGSARDLAGEAAERYRDASARVGQAAEGLATKARAVRDDAADAVVSGAHDIARVATAAKS